MGYVQNSFDPPEVEGVLQRYDEKKTYYFTWVKDIIKKTKPTKLSAKIV